MDGRWPAGHEVMRAPTSPRQTAATRLRRFVVSRRGGTGGGGIPGAGGGGAQAWGSLRAQPGGRSGLRSKYENRGQGRGRRGRATLEGSNAKNEWLLRAPSSVDEVLNAGGRAGCQAVACLEHPQGAGQGCIRREGTSEAAPEAGRQAVGGGCRSGWGRLLSVTNAVEAGTCRRGDSGWA